MMNFLHLILKWIAKNWKELGLFALISIGIGFCSLQNEKEANRIDVIDVNNGVNESQKPKDFNINVTSCVNSPDNQLSCILSNSGTEVANFTGSTNQIAIIELYNEKNIKISTGFYIKSDLKSIIPGENKNIQIQIDESINSQTSKISIGLGCEYNGEIRLANGEKPPCKNKSTFPIGNVDTNTSIIDSKITIVSALNQENTKIVLEQCKKHLSQFGIQIASAQSPGTQSGSVGKVRQFVLDKSEKYSGVILWNPKLLKQQYNRINYLINHYCLHGGIYESYSIQDIGIKENSGLNKILDSIGDCSKTYADNGVKNKCGLLGNSFDMVLESNNKQENLPLYSANLLEESVGTIFILEKKNEIIKN